MFKQQSASTYLLTTLRERELACKQVQPGQ
jgi:hypothetical protein